MHPQPLPSEPFHPDTNQTTAEPSPKNGTGKSARRIAELPHRGMRQEQAWKATSRGDPSKTSKRLQKHRVWVPQTSCSHTDSPLAVFTARPDDLGSRGRKLCYHRSPHRLPPECLRPSTSLLWFLLYLSHNILSHPSSEMFSVTSVPSLSSACEALCKSPPLAISSGCPVSPCTPCNPAQEECLLALSRTLSELPSLVKLSSISGGG